VNGDKKADIIARNKSNNSIDVTLSNGSKFGGGYKGYQIWNANPGMPTSQWKILDPADINGDFKADIIAWGKKTGQIVALTSNGSRFGADGRSILVNNSGLYYPMGYNLDWTFLSPRDINGDQSADIIAINGKGLIVAVTSQRSGIGVSYISYRQDWNSRSGYTSNQWKILD